MARAAKPKPVNYDLIPEGHEAYKLLDEVRDKWHEDLYGARIALAYRKRLKRDHDGILMLGQCRKCSDLQKEFSPYDFIIVLNREVWQDTAFDKKKRLALLDHEMCHAALSLDKQLDRRTDEKGRTVYRVRKHDIEEFRSVVERHGCYKADLEKFAESLLKKRATPLLAGLDKKEAAKKDAVQ
jgi:putative metallopeptidase